MEKYLMTVRLDGSKTIEAVAKALKIPKASIDLKYGVVEVDPEARLFAVMVEQQPVITENVEKVFRGPFANPKIETFGPRKLSLKS
jgi:hypothetical protein